MVTINYHWSMSKNYFSKLDGLNEEILIEEVKKIKLEKKINVKPPPKWMNRNLISKNLKSNISVVTYNILCSEYAIPKYFTHVKKEYLDWE